MIYLIVGFIKLNRGLIYSQFQKIKVLNLKPQSNHHLILFLKSQGMYAYLYIESHWSSSYSKHTHNMLYKYIFIKFLLLILTTDDMMFTFGELKQIL